MLLVILPGISFSGYRANKTAACRIAFYNTENFFDTHNDSLKEDDEFTPAGSRHWNEKRYKVKLENLYKTVLALGSIAPPEIIGLCEIENKKVMIDLVDHTPISKFKYRIIHSDSPDKRGIDVAMIYNPARVNLLKSRYYGIQYRGLTTREILYSKFLVAGDTLHVFVNHWPSRSGGQLETDAFRKAAAAKLRTLTDSLFRLNADARIVITGDFNDEPGDASVSFTLGAKTGSGAPVAGKLYNLSKSPTDTDFKGTLKYKGEWTVFDQVIVSGSMLKKTRGLYTFPDGYHIFGQSFLLTLDEQYNGFKPNRTYNGYQYNGGYSDHLPVYLDLYK